MNTPTPTLEEPSADRSLLWRRMAAYAIDIVLLFAALTPLAFAGQWLTGFVPDSPRATWAVQLAHFSLPAWAYFFVADRSARGATLGRRWLDLRVVAAAWLLLAALSGGRRSAHDRICATRVERMTPASPDA